ncbi:MAG: uncharacterized protein H6Q37_1725 [Chloroflexi bacterium]|nr:uncharacterized protein [Chloroflexota bacterium]
MNCSQCQGLEELFSQERVAKQRKHYRTNGPDRTTCMLTDAIKEVGVTGLTLLDIGGGLGAIEHELIEAGIDHAIDVEASRAYLNAAAQEAKQHGYADRVTYYHGNFVELVADVSAADIVTLDRVICCYPDMEKLVSLSASRALKLYGLVYPRDTWWIKAGLALSNLFLRVRRSDYRGFIHPTKAVEVLLTGLGFKRHYYRRTLFWQVAVYTR